MIVECEWEPGINQSINIFGQDMHVYRQSITAISRRHLMTGSLDVEEWETVQDTAGAAAELCRRKPRKLKWGQKPGQEGTAAKWRGAQRHLISILTRCFISAFKSPRGF